MKNATKFFRIIAFAVIIGLTTGSLAFGAATEWPSQADWETSGLSGGLQQPSRTNVTDIDQYMGVYIVTLANANRSAYNNLVNQMERKDGWTVQDRTSGRSSISASFVTDSENTVVVIILHTRQNSIDIIVVK
jgi:hypothetical protein